MTIPASYDVQVIPGVLNAGGNALELINLCLTQNTRVPVGAVLSFPDAEAVEVYFGPLSKEAQIAGGGLNLGEGYFGGFTGCTAFPAAQLFAQYNSASVSAYERGGAITSYTIPQLAALSGALTIVMDGYTFTNGSVSLSGATSYSAAAALIQTAINASPPAGGSSSAASIAPATASITATIAGYVMAVSNVASGTIQPGAKITAGAASGTQVTAQLTGTPGGIGTYAVSIAQVVASATLSLGYGVLTVGGTITGTFSVGQIIVGAGVTTGTQITALGSGIGLAGTYYVQDSQTVASEAMTSVGAPIAVSFDSISGALVFTSGSLGTGSTVAFASGSLAVMLNLTQATGAVLSQGAYAATPQAFMEAIVNQTTNWATFMTAFDPDGGSGNAQKLQFAGWVNTTNDEFMYVCWDTDITPTESTSATTSMGYILKQSGSNGTFMLYEPSDLNHAQFVCSIAASLDFSATNGSTNFKFRNQSGLIAGVTSEAVAANLNANGYNCYSVSATANQQFTFLREGVVSGDYEWAQPYVQQIWLNAALQLALLNMLTILKSVPYNAQGYASIEAAMQDPINAALNFGAIRAGVPLSQQQINEITVASGNPAIAGIIATQGYFVQVLPASPQVRQARGTPPINFWYTDGGSVNRISLASIDVQ